MRWRLALLLVAACALGLPRAAALEPNDPAFSDGLQWGLERIGAPQAWDVATGTGVTIAIVDSGVDLDHQDLKGKIKKSTACLDTGGDASLCKGSAEDDHGHGTHVAGIAAATSNNGAGVAGTAPGADLMVVKVLEKSCTGTPQARTCSASGSSSDVSAGIRWATDQGADVINLSLGSTTSALLGPSFASAIQYAWGKGTIPVVAAGNDFVLSSGFADEPAVVVAATNRDDKKASYSNGVGSAKWAISAPGGEGGDDPKSCGTGADSSKHPLGVLSTYWDSGQPAKTDTYACLAGTSMAAPHVSGALAVLLSQGLSPQQAVDRLMASAADLGSSGADSDFGAGRLDLAKAVGAAPSKVTVTTAATTTQPPAPDQSPPATAADAADSTTTTTTAPPANDADDASGTEDTGVPVDLPETSEDDQALPSDVLINSENGPAGRASGALETFAGVFAIGVGAAGVALWRRGVLQLS